MTTNADFDAKMQELTDKVQELEDTVTAFKSFVQPSFELAEFHKHYDPVTETAKAAHDIYHQMLHLRAHAH